MAKPKKSNEKPKQDKPRRHHRKDVACTGIIANRMGVKFRPYFLSVFQEKAA